jgi:acyl-CoA thioester hydrolase
MTNTATERSAYPYFSELTTRWMDNDIYGHMNNVIYYELFDTAVNKWLLTNDLLNIQNGKNIGLIVKSGCDFFSSFVIETKSLTNFSPYVSQSQNSAT